MPQPAVATAYEWMYAYASFVEASVLAGIERGITDPSDGIKQAVITAVLPTIAVALSEENDYLRQVRDAMREHLVRTGDIDALVGATNELRAMCERFPFEVSA